MATKEFREFFLRAAQVNSGTKPDKELGFPVQYQVVDCDGNPINVFNRFLKNHVPSEAVFKKLFESITFKLNPEDTANTSDVGQGLVRIAIGENIVNRVDTESGFTTVVVPTTLPKVSAASGCTVTPVIRRVSDNVIVGSITPGDRGLYYIDYQITVTPVVVIDNVKHTSYVEIDTTTINEAGIVANGLGSTLHTVTIAANTLTTNGDVIEIETTIDKSVSGVGSSSTDLSLYVGNTGMNNDTVPYIIGAALDPALIELAYHVHVKAKIYRTSASTARAITTVKLYTRPNAVSGDSLYSTAANADMFFTKSLTIDMDFTQPIVLDLFMNVDPALVNEHTPLLINQFIKTILD